MLGSLYDNVSINPFSKWNSCFTNFLVLHINKFSMRLAFCFILVGSLNVCFADLMPWLLIEAVVKCISLRVDWVYECPMQL